VGNTVLFVASDSAFFTIGTSLMVDGGFTAVESNISYFVFIGNIVTSFTV
jgi:hypothetical protein